MAMILELPISAHRSLTQRSDHLLVKLLWCLHLQLANSQDRVSMLTPHRLHLSVPPLRLFLEAHRLRLDTYNGGPALIQPLVNIRGLVGSGFPVEVGRLKGEVARAQDGGTVETEDVSREDTRHLERQAHAVAERDKVGTPVDVDSDVVGGLGAQEREELFDDLRNGAGRLGWLGGGRLSGVGFA